MITRFHRVLLPSKIIPLQVCRLNYLELGTDGKSLIDGRNIKAKIGCWMFYLPKIQAKIFHARNGMIDCTVAPKLEAITDMGQPIGQYQAQDWFNALQTPIGRRLAEIWIISVRLWKAGISPQPLGICFVEHFIHDGVERGPTCGLLTQNVHKLPRKRNCKLKHIIEAGVAPDKILSCVRQQHRGYVIDLCSVVGCQPQDAEPEINNLTNLLKPDIQDEDIIAELTRRLEA